MSVRDVPVVTLLVCFLNFAREAMGAGRAPGIPCALCFRRVYFDISSGAPRREDVEAWQQSRRGHPSRRGLMAAPQDEVITSGVASDPQGEEAQSAVSNHHAPIKVEDCQVHSAVSV